LGGELVAYESELALFFRDTINLARIFDFFHDIRTHPRIRLKDILVSVFLMPYWGLTALLRLDFHLRTPAMLRLFGCPQQKKVVVSDTTIARVLKWLDPQDCRQALLAPLASLNKQGLLRCRLAPKGPSRRLGVLDGSQMGDHYLVAALLCAQMNYPVLTEPCQGRGHELKTAIQLLPIAHRLLGSAAPQLWLLDGYYFNQTTFHTIRAQGAHLLIKYSPEQEEIDTRLFRDVLEDAKALFAAPCAAAFDPVDEDHGFDSTRCCSWSIKKTSAEFAGHPVNIFLLEEDYPKKHIHTEAWIITTDLTLDFQEAREAAHLRWQIENNQFKRLSHHAGTKSFYFKDPRPFFALLRLFCLALTVFDAFFAILHRSETASKALMQGCKFTWKAAFSQMEWNYPDAFQYLVTAGT
jgi:hypothetical protein